jgi:DNA invertase Pin-like site-specific DNA recombinase
MPAVRAACYARFSSDLQRATSIEDQIAVARAYAERHSWSVLDDHIYTDAAISGLSLERPGIQALRAAALRRPLPFDVVLVDDSSRIARDLADAVRLLQELRFSGVRVIYISQNIDSANEQAETLVAVHGVVDSLYLKEMAKKIKRGLAGQLERGFATGGITYGYRTVPVADPSGKSDVNGYPVLLGKRVEIQPAEARVVAHIFEWYANGLGIGRIVERLNRERLPGPRGRRWQDGAVKRVLANEKYLGRLIWGKKSFERRPGTGQYVTRPIARELWRSLDREELRIVDQALWDRVAARRLVVRQLLQSRSAGTGPALMRGRHAALFSSHLFSGFMKCAECHGAVVVVTGGYGSPRYGCRNSWRNGVSACGNRLTIRAKVADAHLLAGLRRELLDPAAVRYVAEALTSALNQQIDERPRLLTETRSARDQTQQRLQRLVEAIENGGAHATLLNAVREREAELTRLDKALVDLTEPIQERLTVIPTWVRQQLDELERLLSETPERTKAEFQRLGLRVTMAPIREAEARPFYRATVVNSLPCLAGITDFRTTHPSAVDRSLPPGG